MQTLNNWTPVAVIIFGYAIGLYFQRTWLSDFKESLYKYLDVRLGAIEERLKKLEDKVEHPVVRP